MKLRFTITREDFAEFNRFHFFRTKLNRTILRAAIVILSLQLFLNKDGFNLDATLISTLMAILTYTVLIHFALKRTSKIPDNNGTILGEKELEFTEESILYKGDHSQGTTDWHAVRKLAESPHAFYLYIDTNMAILVPKRAFVQAEDADQFRELANRKINPS